MIKFSKEVQGTQLAKVPHIQGSTYRDNTVTLYTRQVTEIQTKMHFPVVLIKVLLFSFPTNSEMLAS